MEVTAEDWPTPDRRIIRAAKVVGYRPCRSELPTPKQAAKIVARARDDMPTSKEPSTCPLAV